MAISVLTSQEMPITSESDVIAVRRRAKALAQERKFDAFATAALTTATSELTRNVWTHAGKGKATIEEVTDGARVGIRIHFRDEGPGIPDIARVLRGGYSTSNTMGLGLSGSKRLVDDFSIESETGRGTVVTIAKWKPY